MLLTSPFLKALVSEALGTALLLAGIVGSGIMAERLSSGNAALALLANALATGALLAVLIHLFAPLSGAHFNPVVSLTEMFEGRLSRSHFAAYVLAQTLGALFGVLAAHVMFALPLLQSSTHIRAGFAQHFSEIVATFGLVLLILRRFSLPAAQVPWLIGAYIAAAYWFTASTGFANPAVTFARSFTHTFAGIRLQDAPEFMLCQTTGALAAYGLHRWISSTEKAHA